MTAPLRHFSLSALLGLAALMAGLALTTPAVAADPGKIVIQADKPGAKISPMLYGIMTEEINYSYDGGLYGELIQNRIFKNPAPRGRGGRGGRGRGMGPGAAAEGAPTPTPAPTPAPPVAAHWSMVSSEGSQGEISLDTSDPINTVALTTSLKLNIATVAAGGRVGVANDGFWGIPVKPDTTYQASFYAKASGGFSGPLTVAIESSDGKTVYTVATVSPTADGKWYKYSVTLKTGQVQPTAAARFVISAASKGTLNFNLVSLFPPTFKGRANGNRPDIMQLLADMKPAFLRFPGGNYVEGSNIENRWAWKNTIGPLEERPTHMSPWGYRSADGMGMLEYLEWCEDINMEPVLAVYAGLCLNQTTVTGEALKPYIQEALDAIEYVTGDTNTTWGAIRAKNGHPAPFKLTYVEVGNEDGLSNGRASYQGPEGRFALFYNAIKAKYPKLQVIATINPNSPHDVIDDHYYMDFNGALRNSSLYDPNRRPRTTPDGKPAPKVFVGEWATRDNNPTPSFHAALTDAAFLLGLERNSDLVIMSGYAPLLVNVNPGGQQWATDLIGYNALTAFGSPSYYVQKMYYNNRGDVVLPVALTPQLAPAPTPTPSPTPTSTPATAVTSATTGRGRRGGAGGFGGFGRGRGRGPQPPVPTMYATSSRDEATGDIILKVVNAVEQPQQMEISLEGAPTVSKTAKMEVLTGGLTDVNTPEEPMKVAPKSSTIEASAKFVREFPGSTVTVIRFSTK